MTARKFLMYELFIYYLGKHHEGVMISCMKGMCNNVASYGTVCWWMNAICGGGGKM